MNNNPSYLVSVVIPLYNKENYINSTIKSVLNQTFSEFELIIVNDGSTDDSLNIVNKIDDSRIKIITQLNGGVSQARNTGIKNSSADWIAFLDADDIWDCNFLSNFISIKDKFTEAFLIASNYGYPNSKENNNFIKPNYIEGYINEFYFNYCLSRYPFNSSSIVVRKSCFHELGGFKENLKEAEDLEMWYRLVKNNKLIAYCPKVLSYYRKDLSNQIQRQKRISLDNFWAYHLNLDNISDKYELLYLQKRLISLSKIVLLNNKSLLNIYLLIRKYGVLKIFSAFINTLKFKRKQ